MGICKTCFAIVAAIFGLVIPLASHGTGQTIYKCYGPRGPIYTNDPDEPCRQKKALDPNKIGHTMIMPSRVPVPEASNRDQRAATQSSAQPAAPNVPETLLERLERALSGRVSPRLPDPTAEAIEKLAQ